MIQKIVRGLTILIALVLIGYVIFMKLPKASVNSKEVVAEISASELFDAFSKNEKEAESQYLGKAVLITGIIDDIYDDETGAPVLILKSEAGEPVALVTLELTQKSKIDSYKLNDAIRIKAQCSGMIMEVTLNKGLIIE